ncbi:MAG: putative acetyltransferase [Patiriisocius sp.]|jgi:putative acetyltransferase
MNELQLRGEKEADIALIHALTKEAFSTMSCAAGDEQDVIDRLRDCGALTLSLVAVEGSELVGQVTFSPVAVADGSSPWFALGPVSVTPDRQSDGIGAKLINAGLLRIQEMGALGCVLTGNPVYYSRFGFDVSAEHSPENEPAEYFQLKLLKGQKPNGRFAFHPAFYGEVES